MQIVILQNQMLIVYIIRDFQCFCYSNNLHTYLNDTISFLSTKVHILKGFKITKFVETLKLRGKFLHIFVAFSENLNFTTVHYQFFFNFLHLLLDLSSLSMCISKRKIWIISKSHREKCFFCIFLHFAHQVDMKNVVECL